MVFYPLPILVIAAFLGAVVLGFPLALWLYRDLTVLTGWVTVGTSVMMPISGVAAAIYGEYYHRAGSDPLRDAGLIVGCLIGLVAWGASIAGSAIPGYFAPAGVLAVIDPFLFLAGLGAWLLGHRAFVNHKLHHPAHG